MEMDFTILADTTLWQRTVELLTTPSLQLFLLLGSFLLVISLLLLTMTRLGHARPITKCVVLSVIAHILLLGYAYGTRLIFQIPVAQNHDPIQVQFGVPDEEEIELPATQTTESLDEFSTQDLAIETVPLAKPEEDIPFEIERVLDFDKQYETETHESGWDGQDIALLEQQPPLHNIETPELSFSEHVELNDPAPKPEEIEFVRHGEGEQDLTSHTPELEALDSVLKASTQLQEVQVQPEIMNDTQHANPDQRVEELVTEIDIPESNDVITEELIDAANKSELLFSNYGAEENGLIEIRDHMSQPRRLGDGKVMPKIYQLRSSTRRTDAALARGGSQETEHAVESALAWLASTQKDDGRWCPIESNAGQEDRVFGHDRGGCGSHAETGITSLATLAFLGAGHTHLEGKYQSIVQNALEFIVRNQAANGDLSGNAKLFARMYCHSMSLLALSEALAITGDPRLEQAVRKGVLFSVEAQDKQGGGWRYQPGDSGDMSQFGWQVMALNAASKAGVEIQPATLERMKNFLASCRSGEFGGLASYRPGQGPSTAMTAEALVCRRFLKLPETENELVEAQTRILDEPPDTSRINLYYWYYATLALQQRGGESWTYWNANLQRVLLSQQILTGRENGSWAPEGLWAGYGGRVYSTALATLCLEVYYRYLPEESVTFQAREVQPGGELDRIP